MLNNVNSNVERIIAKIDNDFNPDNSDWIPRVGAWCIEAMSQLDVLRTITKKKKLTVKDRIAYSECPIDSNKLKVYDKHNCEIKQAKGRDCCYDKSFTGDSTQRDFISNTTGIVVTDKEETPNYIIAETVNDKYPYRYNIHERVINTTNIEHNYVIIDCDKIELNYDTDYIFIETEVIETTYSDIFGCELPVIPNNGILIEAIGNYCIYKMLCRGYKHPVFNLNASQYGTNPYYIWTQLKEQAKRSILNDNFDENSSKLFRSNFFIDTFDNRN